MEFRQESFKQNHSEFEITSAYNSSSAIEAIKNTKFDIICLDHDLAVEHYECFDSRLKDTGFDVAKFIAEQLSPENYPQLILVHTWNPHGALRMVEAIKPTGIPVYSSPYAPVKMFSIKGEPDTEPEK